MIGPAPEFTHSKFFKATDPDWHLENGASETEKRELEEFMNGGSYPELWKERYPEMKKPYYCWNGEVEDRG